MANFSLNKVKEILTNRKVVFLIAIFTLAVFFAIFWLALTAPKTERPSTLIPTPTTLIPPNPAVLNRIIARLPAETQTFRLSYDSYTKEFHVLPKVADLKQAREELSVWFAQQGVLNIEALKIVWSPLPGSLPGRRPIK